MVVTQLTFGACTTFARVKTAWLMGKFLISMDACQVMAPTKSLKRRVEQLVAGERGIAPFSTSFVRRGLRVTARAT
jgi:hypothetical protein